MYKLLGRTIIDGCNNTIVPESKDEESRVPDVSGGDTMLWHQRLTNIGEKDLNSYKVKVWLKVWIIVIQISVFVNIVHMASRIE